MPQSPPRVVATCRHKTRAGGRTFNISHSLHSVNQLKVDSFSFLFACMYAATLTQFTAMTPTSVFQAGFRCTHFAFRNHPPRTNKNPQFSLKSSFLPGNSDLDLPHLPTSRQRRHHTGLHELFRAFDPGLPRHLHASQTKRVPKRAAEHPTLNGPTPGERGRNAPSRSPTDSIQPNRRDSGTPESVADAGEIQ